MVKGIRYEITDEGVYLVFGRDVKVWVCDEVSEFKFVRKQIEEIENDA